MGSSAEPQQINQLVRRAHQWDSHQLGQGELEWEAAGAC